MKWFDPGIGARYGRVMENKTGFLDLWSGVGLVLANMIGAGVLVSTGFMAQSLEAGPILWAWVFGLALALLGCHAYGAVAAVSGKSGGEYQYLKSYMHPYLGYLAGWGSLLLGFSAPIAVDALAIGAYANTFMDGEGLNPRILGTVTVIALTGVHALNVRSSKWSQNALVMVKVVLILGFIGLGLSLGSNAWPPEWVPPSGAAESFPYKDIFLQQFWIAFAFAGWNAAIYAAGEFKNPKRDVPRAMLIGCTIVGLLYLVVNWVFVTNLTPEMATVVFSYDDTKITLGHAVMESLWEHGGTFMSGFVLLAFVSAISAMTLVGPRVYAEMARDGFLPKFFAIEDGRPPVGSLILQGAVALAMVWTHSILEAVQAAGLVILLFSGLTALSLFNIKRRADLPDPPPLALVTGGLYGLVAFSLIAVGAMNFGQLRYEVGGLVVVATIAFFVTKVFKKDT